MLRYLTAGESHGRAILAILEGLPAGLRVEVARINQELKRRQLGFGRGRRMQIENDRTQILSGLKHKRSLGSPIAFLIENKDFRIERMKRVLSARPGHADLAGLLKYGFRDITEVLERASARSTVATVGIGALCKILLAEFKIKIASRVISIGGEWRSQAQRQKIKSAINQKDTLGGIFEVVAKNVPVGLGSYVQPDRRLDGKFAKEIIAIPGIKAVEFGLGFGYADRFGSQVHDAIYYSGKVGFFRKTNNAGGIEGGISNGDDIVIRACMKPISTLMHPLDSVNIATKKPCPASVQRSDICVVEAAGVVAEGACAFVLADALLEKFGGDNLSDIKKVFSDYQKRIR
jgi:chorismate synthase